MIRETYNGRKIIWESKTKQVLLIATSFVFVILAFWTIKNYLSFGFLGSSIFFGMCGLLALIRFLNPKNIFIKYDSDFGRQVRAELFQRAQEDYGFFDYNETGFTITGNKGNKNYCWAEIETIFCYKEDYLTTDDICLEIFIADGSRLNLSEETPGWHQFNIRLVRNFPVIPDNWEAKIMNPAFKTNLTLLFDKAGRSKEQAEAECYQEKAPRN